VVTVFGAKYSVYTRIVRLALEEKGVSYRFSEVDIFAEAEVPKAYFDRHPFAKIPAFEHEDCRLYETGAIARFVDEAFDGPDLQPSSAVDRARMNQVISIADSYGYPKLVWDIFVERKRKEDEANEERIIDALPFAETIVDELSRLKSDDQWLAGAQPSLADCYVAPMLVLFRLTPEGGAMLVENKILGDWLDRFCARASAVATQFPIEASGLNSK